MLGSQIAVIARLKMPKISYFQNYELVYLMAFVVVSAELILPSIFISFFIFKQNHNLEAGVL